MTVKKKPPVQPKRKGTPLVAGIGLPDADLKFDPAVPIGKLMYGEDAGGVTALRRYDNMATEALKDSMKKFGFIEPIVAARDGRIIHGVHRYQAAVELEQATVPVIWVDNWKHNENETQFYNAYANKMNDWSSWVAENVDEVLRKLDGGIKRRVIPGDDSTFVIVPDESGEYREMAGKLGMFVDVIPKQLCAQSATLLTLAHLRIKSLGRRYQYNDEQLLYIETLRNAVDYHRKKAVDEGLDTSGNLKQKLEQEAKWDAKSMADGRLVARIVFLHSVGLSNHQISKITGVPETNREVQKESREANLDTFREMVTVENALWRSAKRSFSPADTYGWWIYQLLDNRANVLEDPEISKIIEELKQYRVPVTDEQPLDGLMPPATRLDLSDRKAVKLRDKAVKLILKKTAGNVDGNGNPIVDEAMAEDYVDWPETLRFYAKECFKHALEEEASNRPPEKEHKTPADVKTTRQSNDKLCGKTEWQEICWLDEIQDAKHPANPLYDKLREIRPQMEDLEIQIEETGDSDDVDPEVEKRHDALKKEISKIEGKIKTMKRKSYAASSKSYDDYDAENFNLVLADLRKKYLTGPINLLSMIGPKHDGDMSGDPDAKKPANKPSEVDAGTVSSKDKD